LVKFLILNLDNTDQKVTVNVDKIVKFWRGPGLNYTVVEFENREHNITVKESPSDIRLAINGD
jgi:hypothetical protein